MAAVRRSAALVGLALSIAACAGGTPASTIPVPSGALELRVVNTRFEPAQLSVLANEPFVLYFDNSDNVPHNVVIVGSDGGRVFAADIFTGAAQRLLQVPALAPGHYRLRCDVHPEMSADLEAVLPAT